MVDRITRREALKLSLGTAFCAWPTLATPTSGGVSDVIVVIPGILGSVLSKNGKEIWSPSTGGIGRALVSLGRDIDSLKLEDTSSQSDSVDGVKAERIVRDIHLIPGLWKIDGYSQLTRAVQSLAGIKPGSNYFEFAYDWRRDNRVHARRLAAMAGSWLSQWKLVSGNKSAKLVLLAHSMGGLICRYFLECLGGWRVTRHVVTYGTPYRGSVNALRTLVEGSPISIGNFKISDLTPLTDSCTSIYQLLPTYPCVDSGDGKLRRAVDVNIPRVNGAKVTDAANFHREIAEAILTNQREDSYSMDGYSIVPIVGFAQHTLQSAALLAKNEVGFLDSIAGETLDGDGTVPRGSATPPELFGKGREIYISDVHTSLQAARTVLDQVKGLLTGDSLNLDLFRGAQSLTIVIPTILSSTEPLPVLGSYSGAAGKPRVRVQVQEAYTSKIVIVSESVHAEDGQFSTEIVALPPGAYRVVVELTDAGGLETRTASDVVVVFDRRGI